MPELSNAPLRFVDDFNSFVSSPDGSTGWMTTGGAGWRTLGSNSEAEYYSDSSVGVSPFNVSNGVLTVSASPGSNPLGLPYNSGILTTEGSFAAEYGTFEVTAKLPAGQGLWPAMWLLPTSLGWPPEVDIMEGLQNDPTHIYVGTHSAVGGPNVGTTTKVSVGDTTQSFNTYAVDWEPDKVTWYFNGEPLFSEATPADMHQPMYLLINLAVGGNGSWPGAPDGATRFPAQMQIDSVHFHASPNTTAVSGSAALSGGAAASVPASPDVTSPTPVAPAAPTPAATTTGATTSAAAQAPAPATLDPTVTQVATATASVADSPTAATPAAVTMPVSGAAPDVAEAGGSAPTAAPTQDGASMALPDDPALPTVAALPDVTPVSMPAGDPIQAELTGWGQRYSGGDGAYAVTGTAGGSHVSLGDGDNTVTVTGINNTLRTGSGDETISYAGTGNRVITGSGTNVIHVDGSHSGISVAAPAEGTTEIVAAGSSETITSTGKGNVSVSGPTGNSHVTLGDGDNTVVLGGSGNDVTVGIGTNTIVAGNESGHNTIHAGGGAATITVTGWNNVLDAGPGMNFLNGGIGSDTFYLNGPGQGINTVTGFLPDNHDVLDLSRTLATAETAADLTNIGNFITAVTSDGNTTLYVDETGGHGTATPFAVLEGVSTNVPNLVANNDLRLA